MSRERELTHQQHVQPKRSMGADYLEAEFLPHVAERAADASTRRQAGRVIQRKPGTTTPSLSETYGLRGDGKTTKERAGDVDMVRRLVPNLQHMPADGANAKPSASPAFPVEGTTTKERVGYAAMLKHLVPQVQHKTDDATESPDAMRAAAANGVATPAKRLPHAEKIQAAFGPEHDVSQIRAHIDPESTRAMGAEAYATGNDVVFAREPDEELAAHEAAHVVQQARGVKLKDGIGERGDVSEANADAVASRVRDGRSATDLLAGPSLQGATNDNSIQRKADDGSDAGQQIGATTSSPAHETEPKDSDVEAPKKSKLADIPGHASNKVEVEFGSGSITGAIAVGFELGATGIGPSELAFLKASASTKINDWTRKFEASLISGKFDGEVFDGVKVAFEASALKVTGKEGAAPDLLNIGVKLSGEVSHWLHAPPGVKVTVDGSIKIALGGRLAAQLSSFIAAEMQQKVLALEVHAVTEAIEKDTRAIKALRQGALSDNKAAAKGVEEKVSQLKQRIAKNAEKLKQLAPQLEAASKKATGAINVIKGKAAKAVAKAMRAKTVRFVASKLAKLVPVLNVASTILDVIEITSLILRLFRGEYGGDGDSETQRADDSQAGGDVEEQQTGETGADVSATDRTAKSDPNIEAIQRTAAINELHPSARQILNHVMVNGAFAGPTLTPDQVRMIGYLVPPLSQKDLNTVISQLRESMRKVQSGEDAIVAIDEAVRALRNKSATVRVNGVDRPDLASSRQADDGLITSPTQVEGPITSPSQVGGAGPEPITISDEMWIVQEGPEEIIGQWFVPKDHELRFSSVAIDWARSFIGMEIHPGIALLDLTHSFANEGEGQWRAEINFVIRENGKQRIVPHVYRVTREGNGRKGGVKVGELWVQQLYKVQIEVVDGPAIPSDSSRY